jgi:Protein of unknown function (DUF3105)
VTPARRAGRRFLALVVASACLVACGGGVAPLTVESSTSPPSNASVAPIDRSGTTPGEAALLDRAGADAVANGCGPVQVVPPYSPQDEDRAHVTELPSLSDYASRPPASGPHFPTPLPAGVYTSPPSLGAAIHSLEHGAVIVWYDPSAAVSPAIAEIEAFFALPEEVDHVILAPFDDPDQGEAGRLPVGQQMAVVAWHRVQACATPSLAVAYAFVFAFRADITHPERYQGEAPEPGLQI